VVLIGTQYWEPYLVLLREMVREGAMGAADLELLKVTDDLDEAIAHLETFTVSPFGLRRVSKPAWWLGERGLQRGGTASTGASASRNTR